MFIQLKIASLTNGNENKFIQKDFQLQLLTGFCAGNLSEIYLWKWIVLSILKIYVNFILKSFGITLADETIHTSHCCSCKKLDCEHYIPALCNWTKELLQSTISFAPTSCFLFKCISSSTLVMRWSVGFSEDFL